MLAKVQGFKDERVLLAVSCPFDFGEENAPNKGRWGDDLNELFTTDRWEHVGPDEPFMNTTVRDVAQRSLEALDWNETSEEISPRTRAFGFVSFSDAVRPR